MARQLRFVHYRTWAFDHALAACVQGKIGPRRLQLTPNQKKVTCPRCKLRMGWLEKEDVERYEAQGGVEPLKVIPVIDAGLDSVIAQDRTPTMIKLGQMEGEQFVREIGQVTFHQMLVSDAPVTYRDVLIDHDPAWQGVTIDSEPGIV